MQPHRIRARVDEDRSIRIDDLPFAAGEEVDIIVTRAHPEGDGDRYPLRGSVIQYIDPTGPVLG